MKTQRLHLIFLAFTCLLFASHRSFADQLVCHSANGTDVCDLTLPNVLAPQTEYPMLQFLPGDVVTVTASGCVQTGGSGNTWKRFFDPSGANADVLYHGRISIPGATNGMVRILDIANKALPASSGGPLMVGYDDDEYDDNGYWSHDNGTENQCADTSGANLGRASIHLIIQHATPTGLSSLLGGATGMCEVLDDSHDFCRVDRPDVTQASENFPAIHFLPGDRVVIMADGCVQTGGSGKTWKDYVHPSGNDSDHLYHGMILIPGVTAGTVPLAGVIGRTDLPASTGGTLTLGYQDDGLGDNGYWKHDDGTENQCRAKGPASVSLSITHPPHVQLDGMEVTQVIQNVADSVPVITAKTTWLRVYISSASFPTGTQIDAVINGTLGTPGSSPPIVIGSAAPLTLVQGTSLRQRRESWTGSLNFLVPASLTGGNPVVFQIASITLVANNSPVPCTFCDSQRLTAYTDAPPLRVKLFGLTYTAAGGAIASPTAVDLGLLQSWLGRAYPVASVNAIDMIVPANDPFPFTCNQANAQLSGIRAHDINGGEDRRRHYYAEVSNQSGFMRGCASGVPFNVPDPTTVASGPTGNPAGPGPVPVGVAGDTDASFGDWYGGHELAHTYGRLHPGFCNGNSKDDLSFPNPSGQISDDLGTFTGLDVGDPAVGVPLTVLPGASTFDIMTYCNQPLWMSAYTYEGILKRLQDEDKMFPNGGAPSSGAQALMKGKFVHIVASVDLTAKTGKFRYVFPVSLAEPQTPRAEQMAELRLLAADGRVLQKYPAAIRLDTDIPRGEHQTALVDVSFPLNERTVRLQLFLGSQMLDEFKASGRPPLPPTGLHIESLTAPDSKNALVVTNRLSWTPSKTTTEPITYIVTRSDDREHWETLGVGITGSTITLTTQQAQSAVLRVTATDGFALSDAATIAGLGH